MNTLIGACFIIHGLFTLTFWHIILGVVIVLGDD